MSLFGNKKRDTGEGLMDLALEGFELGREDAEKANEEREEKRKHRHQDSW